MVKLFANDTIGPLYAEQLRKEHYGSKWGSTGLRYSGNDLAQLIESRPYLHTALDYGCGKGTLAAGFPNLVWVEYDPGIPGKDKKPNGEFDLVTCTDVLEHIEPEKLQSVLRELASYTKKCLFLDIACYPTGKMFAEGPYKGQDLHLIVESPDWWRIQLAETGLQGLEFKAIDKFSKGKWKTRLQAVLERV